MTNSDDRYVDESVKLYGLHPAGIATSEQAKYSKPRKEIFLYALEKFNLEPSEVLHVGDSLNSDVMCPESVGIKAVWLNREKKSVPEGITSIDSIEEIFEIINV